MDLWETLTKSRAKKKKKGKLGSLPETILHPSSTESETPPPRPAGHSQSAWNTRTHFRGLLVTGPFHEPGCPTHLNEQAGEFGRQLSSSGLDVVLHQEAHAPDPAHSDGDLESEWKARRRASSSLLRAAGPGTVPSPGISGDPGSPPPVPTPPSTTSLPRLSDGSHKEALPGCGAGEQSLRH